MVMSLASIVINMIYIRVASRAAKRLKTYDLKKWGKINKVSKVHWMIPWCAVSLSK